MVLLLDHKLNGGVLSTIYLQRACSAINDLFLTRSLGIYCH